MYLVNLYSRNQLFIFFFILEEIQNQHLKREFKNGD